MRIAAYCRVSTDRDEQLDSLYNQKLFFTEYAQKHGHSLVRLYADEGISGVKIRDRAEFRLLLEDARLGLFDMVVVKDISRFARNTVDFLQSIRTLKELGVETTFLTANMTVLGSSEFVLTIFGALAQEESANLSKRVKFGKKMNAQRGRVPPRIFGYERIDNFTLEIQPQEAQVVREIFRLYLEEELGCRSISVALDRQGHRTKFGCRWEPAGVRRILINPIYCGEYVNNKYEIRDFMEGRQVKLPPDQHLRHHRPQWAIVDRATFERTQVEMQRRRSGPLPPQQQRRHLFSGMLRCAHCSRAFTRRQYTYLNTRVFWKCVTNDQFSVRACDNRTKLDEGPLLARLRTMLEELVSDPQALVRQLADGLTPNPQRQDAGPDQTRRLALRTRYQEMYANDLMTLDELREKMSMLFQGKDRDAMLHAWSEGRQEGTVLERHRARLRYFLSLDAPTNQDLRQILEELSVDREGGLHLRLKHL